MKNTQVTFDSLYAILREYFTVELPHFASPDSAVIVQAHLDKTGSSIMVRGPGLQLSSNGHVKSKVDMALINTTERGALNEDINTFIGWLKANDYLELSGKGDGFYRATNKMVQTRELTI